MIDVGAYKAKKYTIVEIGEADYLHYNALWSGFKGSYYTLEEAKEVCQKDHEQNILGGLEDE